MPERKTQEGRVASVGGGRAAAHIQAELGSRLRRQRQLGVCLLPAAGSNVRI